MYVEVTWSPIPNFLVGIDCEIIYKCLMILKYCELRIGFESVKIVNFDKFSRYM